MPPTLTVPLAFALSGAAAVAFESLWFHQVGLVVGNSVWAVSLVTASFMAGLALGNALAGRWGGRVASPLRWYARIELVVALLGVAVVVTLPSFSRPFAAGVRAVGIGSAAAQAVRGLMAFLALVVPAGAMGATLPLGVEVLNRSGRTRFGGALGALYGLNTLGAVAGAVVCETTLVPRLGVAGAAIAAGGLDLLAATLALSTTEPAAPPERLAEAPDAGDAVSKLPGRLLAASALAGAILLALETVWFRFLLQFVCGTALAFASMLATVLAGIGLGGALGGLVVTRWPRARAFWPLTAALAAGLTVRGYASFPVEAYGACGLRVFAIAVPLVLPPSAASGLLFTLLGTALRASFTSAAEAVGRLTLANTLGALVGGLAGGLLLLPRAGVEISLFALAAGYLLVVLLGWPRRGTVAPLERGTHLAALAIATVALLLFPSGAMRRRFLPVMVRTWQGMRVVAVREGLTETSIFLRSDLWGHPISYRLVTNGFSMAATGLNIDRYTRLFAYWPGAVHPHARRALLISYGVGATADALTENDHLQAIDVVDISPDILELNRSVRPHGRDPLADPRVRLHVEDGRQFLLVGREPYDIITGEPPPPLNAGVVNLYSAEYFRLMRERLAEGGVATYWLPVHQMPYDGALAVIAAFCGAFPDCSLWSGYRLDWMLVGTRNLRPPSEEDLRALGQGPSAASLRDLGYETPDRLFATFLADHRQLEAWTSGRRAVTDNWPYRLGHQPPLLAAPYRPLWDPDTVPARFAESDWIRAVLPASVRDAALRDLPEQGLLARMAVEQWPVDRPEALAYVRGPHPRRFTTLWLQGLNEDFVRAARASSDDDGGAAMRHRILGASALADGDAATAAAELGRALDAAGPVPSLRLWRGLALCLAGDETAARDALRGLSGPALSELPVHCR